MIGPSTSGWQCVPEEECGLHGTFDTGDACIPQLRDGALCWPDNDDYWQRFCASGHCLFPGTYEQSAANCTDCTNLLPRCVAHEDYYHGKEGGFGTPGPPRALETTEVGATYVDLAWSSPDLVDGEPGAEFVQEYKVMRMCKNWLRMECYYWQTVEEGVTGTVWRVPDLEPGKLYEFAVIGKNSAGWGDWSSTIERRVGDVSLSVDVSPTRMNQHGNVEVIWSCGGLNDEASASIVEVWRQGPLNIGNRRLTTLAVQPGRSGTWNGPLAFNVDKIFIKVIVAEGSQVDIDKTGAVITLDKPGVASAPTVTSLGGGDMRVEWAAPAGLPLSVIEGYTVYWKNTHILHLLDQPSTLSVSGTSTQTTVSTSGGEYRVWVEVVTRGTDGNTIVHDTSSERRATISG